MRVLLFAAAMASGAWWLQQQAALPDPQHALLIVPLGLFACLATKYQSRIGETTVLACWLLVSGFVGYYWAAQHAHFRLASELGASWQGRDVLVEGVIAKMSRPGDEATRIVVDVERVRTLGANVPRRISLTWYAKWSGSNRTIPELLAGQRWQMTVRLQPAHGNLNPHGFDSEAWMLERGIRARGYVRDAASAQILAPMVWHPRYVVERIRERVRTNLQGLARDDPMMGVITALAIGDQRAISPEQWVVFTRTGVNHLMSISGLHITMVAGLMFAIVLRIWRRVLFLATWVSPVHAATLAGLLFAIAYAALSGFAIPAQRTIYMLSVVALALWSGWRWPAPAILGTALLLVVILDPMAVTSAGFWLSFGAVTTIVLVGSADKRATGILKSWVRVQWAITIALTPVLLVLFQKVSIVSPIANAIAIPVVSLCVAPLALLLIIFPIELIATLAQSIMAVCYAGLELLASLRGAVWQQHAPVGWTVALALAGVILILLPRGLPGRWLGAILLLPMFSVIPPGPQDGELWLTALDVGQGLSVVARTSNHAVLFDTGPDYRGWGDAGQHIVVPYLRGEGIVALDTVVVSHDDLDHSGGMASVLATIPSRQVLSSINSRKRAGGEIEINRCEAGHQWTVDNVKFEILHPTIGSYLSEDIKDNDRSCVLRITSRFGSALLPADIERRSERHLLMRYGENLAADVLIAPHHGSRTSSDAGFVTAVAPKLVIFPVGYANRYGHPHPNVESLYRRVGARSFRTDRQGAITIKFSGNGIEASTWRDRKRRYWHRQSN